MMTEHMTLDQCGRARHLHDLQAGRYSIEYNDSTHLQPTEWVRLAHVDVHQTAIRLEDDGKEQFYTVTVDIGDLPGKPQKAEQSGNEGRKDVWLEYQGRIRTIKDTFALVLGRIGLLTPNVPNELLEQLLQLNEQDGIVIVPDTNALYNGAVHWLLQVLHRPAVWLLPVVASLTTIQTRDATVKGLVNKFKISNVVQALRSRSLVNGALGLLQRNRGRCQVIEIDASLLRYQKVSSTTGADPDQSDVLEDRLIIEAIHDILRSMRSRTARRVVTSDVNVARILEAEGIETLFVPSIILNDNSIECLRFDALARRFVGAPLRALLWELTHAFGSIRLTNEGSLSKLECHWPAKTPTQWANETLLCTFVRPSPPLNVGAVSDTQEQKSPKLEVPSAQSRRKKSQVAPLAEEVRSSRTSLPSAPAKTKESITRQAREIKTILPRASLPQVLRILATARRIGGGTVEEIVAGLQSDPIIVDNASRALEILRRLALLEHYDSTFRPTNDSIIIEKALEKDDLDLVSSILERFVPYKYFIMSLQDSGRIRRDEVVALLRDHLGKVGKDESERLPRFHMLLGQAWTMGEFFFDGSQRPTDRDAIDAFEEAFSSTSSLGIAKVRDFLPRFCASTRMSPWAAKRKIDAFVAGRLLKEYTFQPAAGGKPIVGEEVIKGPLDSLTTEPVFIDRLNIGGRPVFTIEGPER